MARKKRYRYYHPLPGSPQGRTDEGVDFRPHRGQGIRAIGDAVIDFIGTYQGFGTYMAYHLTSGPLAGKEIYVSESITLLVRRGQHVKGGQAIAIATGASKGIEMGYAQKGGSYLPVANPTYSEGQVTRAGQQFAQLLSTLSRGGPISVPAGSMGQQAQQSVGGPSASAVAESQTVSALPTDMSSLGSAEQSQPAIFAPGSVQATSSAPQQQQSTWQLLASQPLTSQETQALYRRVQLAGGQ